MKIERVMVVGGRASLVNGNLKRKLGEHGISVIKHHEEPQRSPPMLKACQGVIVIKDMVSHAPIQKLLKDVQARDLPIAFIPRKWSKAEPVLRSRGFLPPATNGKIQTPTQVDLDEMAFTYLVEERRKGRVPHQTEVQVMVQRAFGPKTTLSKARLVELHSRAAAEIPFPDARVVESNRQQTTAHIREFTLVLLEEAPECILDRDQLVVRVFKQLDKHQKSLVSKVDVKSQVIDTIAWKQAQWTNTEVGRESRNKHIDAWIGHQWEQFKKKTGPWPTHNLLNKEGTTIFGIAPPKHLIKSTRARVLGEWAFDLIGSRKVDTNARIKWGFAYSDLVPTYEAFLVLLDEGTIQGYAIHMSHRLSERVRWMSSLSAVRIYLESQNTIEPPKPSVEGLDREVVLGPSFTPALSASDIAVEVGLLLETSIQTQVEEAVAKFETKITQSLLETLQASSLIGGQVETLVEHLGGIKTQIAALNVEDTTGTSPDQLALVEKGLGRLDARLEEIATGQSNMLKIVVAMSEGTGKALNDHNQLIMDQLTELSAVVTRPQGGGDGSGGVSLRDLAELAQEFDLAVTVEAGKGPKNKG